MRLPAKALLTVAAPILLPLLGALVLIDRHFAYRLRRPFWVRIWWFYGYRGVYKLGWAVVPRYRRSRRHAQCLVNIFNLEQELGIDE